jgi:hypothetical protein
MDLESGRRLGKAFEIAHRALPCVSAVRAERVFFAHRSGIFVNICVVDVVNTSDQAFII